uniref:Uncharacterized protein n=1 Tax=Alexandrium monilatum TaxID=311494 RepID=A0A7S4UN53_9DINO|mmetsp:Transcript_110511/g.330620  ORF Transcript_110511/g.330620 Transcript_110511/m.330620 type:complete len:447 (+) Transcript_110511:88-1428(+)
MDAVEVGGISEPLVPNGDGGEGTPAHPEKLTKKGTLPDLTERIVKAGFYNELVRYRQGYRLWRQGKHMGARGEPTAESVINEWQRMESLEPTEEEWNWRKTISYWIAVANLEGSFIFLFTSFSGCYPGFWGKLIDEVTVRAVYIGGTLFYVSIYLMCFEVMNLKRPADEIHWNPFNVRRHLKHCHDIGLHSWPYFISLFYFIGANMFQVDLTAALIPSVVADADMNFWLVLVPEALGGVFFFLASLGELVEWYSGKNRAVGFCVFNDVMGCFLFALAGFMYMLQKTESFDPEWVGGMMFTVGSLNFVLSGVVSLVLWRDGNFGLTYSAQLGKLAPHQSALRFSMYSIALVTGLCLLGSVASVVFFCESRVTWWTAHDETDYVTRAFYPFLIFVIIHMVIALRAAVVKVPTEQPWRALHKACYLLLAMASAVLLAQLAECVWQAQVP